MFLCLFDNLNHIVHKDSKVGDGVVDVCGFVDANKGFIENKEKVFEKLECDGL